MYVKLDLASVTQSLTIDITLVFMIDCTLYSMQSILNISSTTITKLCVTEPLSSFGFVFKRGAPAGICICMNVSEVTNRSARRLRAENSWLGNDIYRKHEYVWDNYIADQSQGMESANSHTSFPSRARQQKRSAQKASCSHTAIFRKWNFRRCELEEVI